MNHSNGNKKTVWSSIYRLVIPYKRRLLSVFVISLLATAVTLFEPLIYREAINDVSGLFIKQGIDEARAQSGDDLETDDPLISGFYEKWIQKRGPKSTVKDSIEYTIDTIHYFKDTIYVKNPVKAGREGHHGKKVFIKEKVRIPATKIVKEPHSAGHVATRTPGQAFHTLLWSVVLLFILNVLGLLFWWLGENMNVRLSCTIERNFIQKTFGHVLKLPLSFFAKRSSAALHKQIDQSEEISGTVSYFTKDIFPELVSLIGIMAVMFWQNYVLALLALSIIPFYLWLTIRSTKRLEMTLTGYYEKWEEVSTRMQDALVGIKTVKLSGAEGNEVAKLDRLTKEAYSDYMKRSFLSHKYSFWQILLTHLATALVLSYGGYLALQHKLTPGDVVMFVAYLDMLYSPIDNLAEIWAQVQQNTVSVGRAFRLLDTEVKEQKGIELAVESGRIEFQNVWFGYSPERKVLKGLSFTAEPGKVTAIVGRSGAGKTTTVDLMLKLFEVEQGSILIDGQNLASLDESSIRRSIGMVSADGAIFRGSLADNIRYKRADASDAEVRNAAYAAGMQATLGRLPDGLDTVVGESGFGLSVGERQRVQIARVIVDKPKVLILDEATANLDYATELEVKKTINEIRKENTVIIIAHRFSMVKDADYVIVMEDGRAAEEGTPQQLLEAGGWFADFANGGDEEEESDESESDENVEDWDEEENEEEDAEEEEEQEEEEETDDEENEEK